MKRKESSQTVVASSAPKTPGPQPHRPAPVFLLVALLLLAAGSILATWADRKPVGDLFVALAGGRDVAAGKLGQPDDWSFLTTGRTWINQNWLSHFLIYLAWRAAGETGLLLLKAALLTAMATFLALLARRRGCTWSVAILLSAGLTMSCSQFVQLRANLLTLVMIPLLLWLLHRTIDNRRRVWWMLPVLLAWANLHGGFIFGIGMVGLWALCITVDDWLRTRRSPFAQDWPLWACAAGCIAVAAVSPFGFENLTHPLVIASSKAWCQVEEHLAAFRCLHDAKDGPAWLQQHQVRLAVLFFGEFGRVLMSGLLASGRWAAIYSDGQSMVLVDKQLSPDLLQQALDGRLTYPSEAIRALSRTVCLVTAGTSAAPAEILAAATQANAARPAPQAYSVIVRSVTRSPALRPGVLLYLEQESSRLSQLPATTSDHLTILLCRCEIQTGLAALHRDMGQPAAARAAQTEADSLDRQIDALQIAWN